MINRSSPPSGVVPTLYYDDVGKAIEFLCGAFGFLERFRYGPQGSPAGAQLIAGEGGLVMISATRVGQAPDWGDQAWLRPPRDGHIHTVLGVRVSKIDEHYDRARAAGARILHEPETYAFGERQYTAEDLAGHRWAFTETVADVAPEDWGGVPGPALRG